MVRIRFRGSSSLCRLLAMLLVVLALSLSWLFFNATTAVAHSDAHIAGLVTDAVSYLPTGAIAKLVPPGNAAREGVYRSDANGTPGNWANPDTIYFYLGPTNILNVVTVSIAPLALTVTPFNTSTYSAGAAKRILLPDFPLWGGFYAAPDGNFYVLTGRENPNEDDSLSVVAVRKYDSSWSLRGTGYLKGGASQGIKGVYVPFTAGSSAMWLTGTTLVVHMARLMYAIDGVHHQGNMTFEVNTSSMAVTPFEDGYGRHPYSSHSFNQLVSGIDTDLVVADHGDAYPRAIQLGVARGYPADRWSFTSYRVFELLGETGDNYTGTTLTGLQVGSGRALVAGSSVPHDHAVGGVTGSGSDLCQNVYVVSTDLATGTPVFRWISSYAPRGTTWASQPRLVKLNDSRFVLLFGARTSTSATLNYRLIDASGAVLAQKSWASVSFDASSQPLGAGSRLYWAGFGKTPSGGSTDNYYLYGLDLTDPAAPTLVTLPVPAPTVTALSPSYASTVGANAVTITGTNLSGATSVKFGGSSATSVVATDTKITCKAPAHAAGKVDVTVTTPGGTSSVSGSGNDYYYTTTDQQTDTHILYGGTWIAVPSSSASGGSFKQTKTAGSLAAVQFTGTRLYWYATTGPTMGDATVSVDGKPPVTVHLYNASPGYRKMVWNTNALTAGSHVVQISWKATSGKYVNIDAFAVAGSLTTIPASKTYQETATGLTWSSGWTATSSPNASGGKYKTTNASSAQLSFKFIGVRLALLARVASSYGRLSVSIDGGPAVLVDLYAKTAAFKTVWTSAFLKPGSHTVVIKRAGSRNSASSGYMVSFDALAVRGTMP